MAAPPPATAGTKRRLPTDASDTAEKPSHGASAAQSVQVGSDVLEVMPLGAGNEVGRSCHILSYKGKRIMLDCGVLPSFTGVAALPFLTEIDPSSIDVIIITHFHLDHCAALPHFTERMTGFTGRIFATHPTIAVMKMLWQDYVRITELESAAAALTVSGTARGVTSNALYDNDDIDKCIARIEALDFHQRVEVDGIRITFYNAGHVLGAAMALIQIASVSVLYTGDYFYESDRHLAGAEVPPGLHPDVLIMESTHGTLRLEARAEREKRFTDAVERIVKRGGKVLIPVFALGSTQELLLILEELWSGRPDLHHVPVLFASKLAAMSLDVYKTYVSCMNERVQDAMRDHNPWDFKYIRRVHERDDAVDAPGPAVVLAAPGMLQSGFSRRLFDRWCEDARNGVVLAGYSTEGTLARKLESNPLEVESVTGRRLARRCTLDRMQFSAHADKDQTAAFVEAVMPRRIVLVHGEGTEMRRLHQDLTRKYSGSGMQVFMPRNSTTVSLAFKEQLIIDAIGDIARKRLRAGVVLSGLLVSRNFNMMLLAPGDAPARTEVAVHTLLQRQHVPYKSSFAMLKGFVCAMFGDVLEPVRVDGRASLLLVDRLVRVVHNPPDRVVLEWRANPHADMIADALVAVISAADASRTSAAASVRSHAHPHTHTDDGHVHAEVHIADDAVMAEADTDSVGLASSDVITCARDTAWALDAPDMAWARQLLLSDTSPFASADVPRAAGAAADAAVALTLPTQYRRDALLALLLDYYGEDAVAYRGDGAATIASSHPFMPSFDALLPDAPALDDGAGSTSHAFEMAVQHAGLCAHIVHSGRGGLSVDFHTAAGDDSEEDDTDALLLTIPGPQEYALEARELERFLLGSEPSRKPATEEELAALTRTRTAGLHSHAVDRVRASQDAFRSAIAELLQVVPQQQQPVDRQVVAAGL